MRRIAAASLLHFFKVDKVLFFLGWGATLHMNLKALAFTKPSEKIIRFFRLRSNIGVYSSSISDCTAYNVAHCDIVQGSGGAEPPEGFCQLSQ